jgi:hypothetical protein
VQCQRSSPKLKDRKCDNVLPGQGCLTREGVVIMTMKQLRNDWQGKTEDTGAKPAPVTLIRY